ncbi:energy transducer TonB [Piscinibacter gummiphilus]|uniref:hypothetical protein n=1 Tax=Piscinibacter gummiphilus TaxID=946333 RepID=UPI0012FDD8CF|nr:hypothetical protein [Piscinibacter gummiphilus]
MPPTVITRTVPAPLPAPSPAPAAEAAQAELDVTPLDETPPPAETEPAPEPEPPPAEPAASAADPVPDPTTPALPSVDPALPTGDGDGDGQRPVPYAELTTKPRLITDVRIVMPPVATGLEAQSGVIAVFLDPMGTVVDVQSRTDTLADVFLQAAREAFMGAKFTQPLVGGFPVPAVMQFEIRFEPSAAPVPGAGSSPTP